MTAPQKAAATLIAVFLLGGLAGGAVGRVTALREMDGMMAGPPGGRMRMRMLQRHLSLRDDQVVKLQAIMDEADAERDKLVSACGPGLDDLRRRTDARVREVLDEQQRKQLDAFQARRGGHHHGPPLGPPP